MNIRQKKLFWSTFMKKNITIFLILAGFAASYLNGMEWGDLNLTEEEIENAKVARLKPEEIAKGRTLKLKLQEMIEAKNSGATLEYMAEQKKMKRISSMNKK